jgi:hypothetical protein
VRRALQIVAVVAVAVTLLLVTAIGAFVGLGAECTGSAEDCPHSDAWRSALIAMPVVAAVLLVTGTAWSVWTHRLWPLVLAIAVVLALDALVDAALTYPDVTTIVILVIAVVVARAALRRARTRSVEIG